MSPTTEARLGNDGGGILARRIPDGPSSRETAASRLLSRLPAVYRETPGVLAPWLEVAAEAIEAERDLIARIAERGRLVDLDRPAPLGAERARGGSGTLGDLRRLLEETGAPVARIATGLAVLPRDGRWIQVVRSRGPSVLLVWDRPPGGTEVPTEGARGIEPPGPITREIATGLLPVRVRLQAVLIRRMPGGRRLLAGEVVQGKLLWTLPAGG